MLATAPVFREVRCVECGEAAVGPAFDWGVYLSGGFGAWELLYPVMATPVTFRALRSYRYIGIAWLMHATWDLPHHLWGNPIWPFMRNSSFGCFVFDSLIAVWFLAGAPHLVTRRAARRPGAAVEARSR